MRHHTGLFIPGPTNIPEPVRRALNLGMEDMRAPDFPSLTLPLFADLKKVFKTESAEVFIFPGSGTGGWEAGLTNTLSPGDRVLAARIGQFSHLWIDMCRKLGLEVEEVDCAWGEGTPVEKFGAILEADRTHQIKAVLVTHNETATGVTSDVAGVRAVMNAVDHPALLFVDAVSSLASIDFRMDEWAVDVAVTGSQKGLMLPTGLGIIAVSPKAMAASADAKLAKAYFDFADMTKANRDGYFPYTPATTMLRGLRSSLDLLFEEGLTEVFARHRRLADGVRAAVDAWGLSLCAKEPRWNSDTVTAIVVPTHIDSGALVRHAYNRYDTSFGIGLSKVAGRVFRIGHLGALNERMVLSALGVAEMALVDMGAQIRLGSGVGAAQTSFCSPWVERRAAA